MKSYDIIGWVHEGDMYCPDCKPETPPPTGEDDERTEEEREADAEIHPVFADSEADEPNGCCECGAWIEEGLSDTFWEALKAHWKARGEDRAEFLDADEVAKGLDAPDEDSMTEEMYDAEMNARCYTPFEFTANEINRLVVGSEEAWEAFDEGIAEVIDRKVAAWVEAREAAPVGRTGRLRFAGDVPEHDVLRTVVFRPLTDGVSYHLLVWDTNEYSTDMFRKPRLGYALAKNEPGPHDAQGNPDPEGAIDGYTTLLFLGTDFYCAPGDAVDSDEMIRSLMGFLTLRPGDTDDDYFADYTPKQRAFTESSACEVLSMVNYCEEEDGAEEIEDEDVSVFWEH